MSAQDEGLHAERRMVPVPYHATWSCAGLTEKAREGRRVREGASRAIEGASGTSGRREGILVRFGNVQRPGRC